MPVSPHGQDHVLRSERAAWEKRSATALLASSQLIDAVELITEAARQNHFGKCQEGEGFFAGLTGALDSLAEQWTQQSSNAEALSTMCIRAADEIERADSTGAADLET